MPLKYQSVAELYIGYVTNAQPIRRPGPETSTLVDEPGVDDPQFRTQILQSFDLARHGGRNHWPRQNPGDKTAGTNAPDVDKAAMVIKQEFGWRSVPRHTQIIRLTFSHQNPDFVKPVLDQLITNYISVSTEIPHQEQGPRRPPAITDR